jgi:hypothetical protein
MNNSLGTRASEYELLKPVPLNIQVGAGYMFMTGLSAEK